MVKRATKTPPAPPPPTAVEQEAAEWADEVNKLTAMLLDLGEQATQKNYTVIVNALLKSAAIIIGTSMTDHGEAKAKEVLDRLIASVRAETMKAKNGHLNG
jgi:hypothetical protein